MDKNELYDEQKEMEALEASVTSTQNKERHLLGYDDGDKFVGWFERLIQIVRKYTVFEIFGTVILIFAVISMLLFFNAVNNEQVLEKWMTKRTEIHTEGSNIRSAINPKVSKSLYKLMLDVDADRVAVFEMHNGKENPTSLPFIYCDMTYEEIKGHLPYISDEYVNLNVSKYKFLSYLIRYKFFTGSIEKLFDMDKKLGIRMMENDVKFCQMALIKTDITIGVLVVTYQEPPLDENSTLREILFKSQQIAAYLDYSRQRKMNN